MLMRSAQLMVGRRSRVQYHIGALALSRRRLAQAHNMSHLTGEKGMNVEQSCSAGCAGVRAVLAAASRDTY